MSAQIPQPSPEASEEPAIYIEIDPDLLEDQWAELDWKEIAALLEEAVAATLARRQQEQGELSLVLTHDAYVQKLNRTYRGLDAPTDVLSFGAEGEESDEADTGSADTGSADFDSEETGAPRFIIAEEAAAAVANYLGDLIIAVPYSAQQAQRFGNALADELCLLAVHGTLHLLGLDHATPATEAEMWTLQDSILQSLGHAQLSRREFDDTDHA